MKEKRVSKLESTDKRFALVDNSDGLRYPYKKTQRGTGKYGFVTGRDRFGEGEYWDNLEEVIRAVVFGGKSVRVTYENQIGNSLTLHSKNVVKGYVISDELRKLVEGAPIAPLGTPDSYQRKLSGGNDKLFGMYAVITAGVLESLVLQGGTGILKNRSNWEAASNWLDVGKQTGEGIPVILRETGVEGGVEWAANIDLIEKIASGETDIHISGLGRLRSPVPPTFLIGFDDSLPLAAAFSQTDVPCLLTSEVAQFVRKRKLPLLEPEELGSGTEQAAAEITADIKCQGIMETVRRALINARIGQGRYRRRMLEIWERRCAVTGCAINEVLVASHALPWAKSTNFERLDPYNGLLLAAHLDKLFDAGLISFNDSGKMLISPSICEKDLANLGIDIHAKLRHIHGAHIPYLKNHRQANGF